MYVIKITFKNGLVGTLTHDNPQQIRYWLDLFSTDQAREKCNIADIVVHRNAKTICYSEVA